MYVSRKKPPRQPERLPEEPAVTELAWGLTGVFRDNPGLLIHLDMLLKNAL